MGEIIDPAGIRERITTNIGEHQDIFDPFGMFPGEGEFDPGLEIETEIEREIKEGSGLADLEAEQARLEAENVAQREEFASLLKETEDAPVEATRGAALARRRRRAGATRASTRVGSRRGQTTPGATGRTTLGG